MVSWGSSYNTEWKLYIKKYLSVLNPKLKLIYKGTFKSLKNGTASLFDWETVAWQHKPHKSQSVSIQKVSKGFNFVTVKILSLDYDFIPLRALQAQQWKHFPSA